MAPGGLVSSAGWEKNDDSRTNANPRQGNSDRDAWSRARYQEKMDSPEVRDYLLYQSQKMGDTEFVGDLVDHLTSNRYYSNDYSEALAGAPQDLGPAGQEGWTGHHNSLADKYGGLVYGADTWGNPNAGGKYAGAKDFNDDKFGLVKLGLYGTQGPSSSQDGYAAGGIYNALDNLKIPAGDIYQAMEDVRTGQVSQENLDWLEGQMGEYYDGALPGSSTNEAWNDTGLNGMPGVFWSDRPGWAGNFVYDTEKTDEEGIFGMYTPFSDTITLDPEDKNIRETTVHELGHRGMKGLERMETWRPGLVGSALEAIYGEGSGDMPIYEDPTTGERFTYDQFLENRNPRGSYGQTPEHNLIDSTSRNRNNRSMFESFGSGDSPKKGNEGSMEISQNAYGVLGAAANVLLDEIQAGKKKEVDTMRQVSDEWYGGKSGTAVSPLIPRR